MNFHHPLPTTTRSARRRRTANGLGVLALCLAAGAATGAQDLRVTPKFREANIREVAQSACELTHRTCILDPRVVANVTVLSDTALTPSQFWELFQQILQVHNFVATTVGGVSKIMPVDSARQVAADDLPTHVSGTSDEFVTQVVAVRSVSAAQLVPVLRPLMPSQANLAAVNGANMLILSDRASNIARMQKIIARIDQGGSDDVDVVVLQNATASDTARVLTSITGGQGAEASGTSARLVADERSNSILVSGSPEQRLRMKTLIAHLDTPQDIGSDTQVRYLRYANAEDLANKLKEQLSSNASAQGGSGARAPQVPSQLAAPTGAGAGAGGATNLSLAGGTATLWAYKEANALVMTAPPRTMLALKAVIDKLDIRRPEVLLQAIVVDVQADKSSELGVNWVVDGSANNIGVGSFVQPVGQTSLVDLYNAIKGTSKTVPNVNGTTVAVGRIAATGVNYAAMIRALQGDSRTNVISKPEVVTLDNKEAKIEVAQEVPFITGQYTGSTGTTSAFQTIQRVNVGTIVKITPHINEGDSMTLDLSIESSSLANSVAGAADLITNKRTIDTSVLIRDGDMMVLGGLIQDRVLNSENRVPLLGRIPLLGELFRTRSAQHTRTNLMVFIKPTIVRNADTAAMETEQKYNYMREEQRQVNRESTILPALPFAKPQPLPPLPPHTPSTEVAPTQNAPEPNAPAQGGPAQTSPVPPAQAQPAPAQTAPATSGGGGQ